MHKITIGFTKHFEQNIWLFFIIITHDRAKEHFSSYETEASYYQVDNKVEASRFMIWLNFGAVS